MENSNVNFDELMSDISEGIKSISSKDGAIKKISKEDAEVILRKSAYSLPTRPSEAGMKPEQIKAAFYRPILDSEKSLIAEVNRVIQESNLLAEKKAMLIQKIVDALKQMDEDVAEGYVKKADGVGGGYVYSTEVGGLMKAATSAEADTLARRDAQGNISVGIPAEPSHAAQKGYVDDNFVPRVGDSAIDGTLAVKSLVVEEGTTLAEVESVMVKEAVIVANSDGVQLAGIYGYVIRVSPERAYGIVYEPASDSLKIGLGVYEVTVEVDPESGEEKQTVNFVFSDDQGQAIATRGQISDGNIPVWNAKKRTFEDSGKRASDFAPSDSPKLLANALKGSESGTAVLLSDVSPIEHDLGVRVSSENLAANIIVTDASNTTYENGVVTQIEADNYETAYLKAQIYQDTTFIIGGIAFAITNIGVHSISFTRPMSGNLLMFGINGRERDTVIRIDIADLPEGDYTISANFTNITQGSISWCDIMLNKGTTASPYTPHISDLSAVKLKAQGKNLINCIHGISTIEGITFTVDEDGEITCNGTATNDVYYAVLGNNTINLTSGIYTLSGNPGKASWSTHLVYMISDEESIGNLVGDTVIIELDGSTIRKCRPYIFIRQGFTAENLVFKPQLEIGTSATEYEPYKSPVEYTVNADGTVDGLKPIAPSTTLMSDTEGVLIECEYNKDANAVVAKLEDRLAALEAAVISQ